MMMTLCSPTDKEYLRQQRAALHGPSDAGLDAEFDRIGQLVMEAYRNSVMQMEDMDSPADYAKFQDALDEMSALAEQHFGPEANAKRAAKVIGASVLFAEGKVDEAFGRIDEEEAKFRANGDNDRADALIRAKRGLEEIAEGTGMIIGVVLKFEDQGEEAQAQPSQAKRQAVDEKTE